MNKLLLSFSLFMLIIVGVVIPPQEAKATHYVGSDITFAYTGTPGLYLVRMTFYRDCGGSTISSASLQYSNSCGTTIPGFTNSISLSLTNVLNVSEVCNGQLTECDGDDNVQGVELYEFSRLVDLSGCDGDWTFSYGLCCRNEGIVNIGDLNSDSYTAFTDAYLNTKYPNINNNSPIFSASPAPYVCLNDTVQYNPQVTDPDGDSLVYSLVVARQQNGNVPYSPGYTYLQPFGTAGFPTVLDPNTGQLTFKPTLLKNYVVVIKVEEWRMINGVPTLVGIVHRDVQVTVFDCSSQQPVLSDLEITGGGLPPVSFPPNVTQEVEACVTYSIKIPAFTQEPGASLTMTTNAANEVPNSVFTVAGQGSPNVTGTLVFDADPNLAGETFSFTVVVTDDVCPVPNKFARAFKIKVNKQTGFRLTASEDSICVLTPVQLNTVPRQNTVALTNPAYGPFTWTAETLSGQPVNGFINDPTLPNPIVSPRTTTRYIRKSTTIYGCEDTASVLVVVKGVQPTIQSVLTELPTDSILCINDQTVLNSTVTGPAGILNTPWTYNWTPIGLNDSSIANPTVQYDGVDTVNYQLIVNNGMCADTASVRIRFVPAAVPTALSNVGTTAICVGDTVNLMASVAGIGTGGSTYSWTGDRVNAPTDSNTFAMPFTVGITRYIVDVTTPLGCTVQDTVAINVKGITPNLEPLPDSITLCNNGITQIAAVTNFDPAAGDPNASYIWSPATGISDPTSPNPFFSYVPGQPLQQTYTLLVASGDCSESSQTTVTFVPEINVTLAAEKDKICVGDTIWLNPGIIPAGVVGATITWVGESIDNPSAPSTFALPLTKGVKEYKITVALGGCMDSASIQVDVEGVNPVISNVSAQRNPICFGDTTTIMADIKPEYELTPAANLTYIWSSNVAGAGIESPLSNSTLITPEVSAMYYITASDNGACQKQDSIFIQVGAEVNPSYSVTYNPDSLAPVSPSQPLVVTFHNQTITSGPVDSVFWVLTNINDATAPPIKLDGISGSASHSFTENSQYTVTMFIYTPGGCVYTLTKPLWIGAFIVPNVITPNGDGINDVFMIPNLKANTTVHIFNRWGKELKTFGQGESWAPDAEVPTGVYFYSVDERNTGRVYKGWLEIIR